MLRPVIRAAFLLVLLAAVGATVAWLAGNPPPQDTSRSSRAGAPAQAAPVGTPAGSSQAALATPFGDALFRWRCATGLKDTLGDRPDWPMERVAHLCLCAAERLREDGPRDIIIGAGEVAPALEAAEARLCRRR